MTTIIIVCYEMSVIIIVIILTITIIRYNSSISITKTYIVGILCNEVLFAEAQLSEVPESGCRI